MNRHQLSSDLDFLQSMQRNLLQSRDDLLDKWSSANSVRVGHSGLHGAYYDCAMHIEESRQQVVKKIDEIRARLRDIAREEVEQYKKTLY